MGAMPKPILSQPLLLLLLLFVAATHAFSIVGYLPDYRLEDADFSRLVQDSTTLVVHGAEVKDTGAVNASSIPTKHIECRPLASSVSASQGCR